MHSKITTLAGLITAILACGITVTAVRAEAPATVWTWPSDQPAEPAAEPTPPAPEKPVDVKPAPEPTGTLMQSLQAPRVQAMPAPAWQQPRAVYPQQPMYRQYLPRHLPGVQYPGWPQQQAVQNPLSAQLKQLQGQLDAKTTELNEARNQLEQARSRLQASQSAEAQLNEAVTQGGQAQQALQARMTEHAAALDNAHATLKQQQQLIADQQVHNSQLAAEAERLRGELVTRDEQLATLQANLQDTLRAFEDERARADGARYAVGVARTQIEAQRDALIRLEAELSRLQSQLEQPQAATSLN